MKKLYLFAILCAGIGLSSCSTDPLDATSKHVYSADETPYLRTDTSCTVSLTAEFRKGAIEEKTFYLSDYAEKIQTKLGMTASDLMTAVDNGSVVFYNIISSSSSWSKTEPNYGTTGWYYSTSGLVTTEDKHVATVSLDKTNAALIVDCPEDVAAGVSMTVNVGFAIDNGENYDDYVRFSIAISVNDPGLVMTSITIPEGDYSVYEIEFADWSTAIETCMGMTVDEFNTAVQDTEGDIAMYMVDSDGNWITDASYTANGIGYWCNSSGTPISWGDGCLFFVETYDGTVGIGRYTDIASGTTGTAHFVYASKSDSSKFVEFVITFTCE